MSDEPHHWLKLWVSAATDPHLDSLDIADFGRWTKLLLYVKTHGNNGRLLVPNPARNICNQLQINSLSELQKMPNINIACNAETSVTEITVEKWYKYQIDNSAERVRKSRENKKPVTLDVTLDVTPQEKIRKDKNKIRKEEDKSRVFLPPTQEEISLYCTERKNNVKPEKFLAHYQSNGWMVGKNKMKDWKAAVRTWEGNEIGNNGSMPKKESQSKFSGINEKNYNEGVKPDGKF